MLSKYRIVERLYSMSVNHTYFIVEEEVEFNFLWMHNKYWRTISQNFSVYSHAEQFISDYIKSKTYPKIIKIVEV